MEFELFVFDLDGTVINTEYLHYNAYLETFKSYDNLFEFSFNEYCRLAHYSDLSMKNYINEKYPFINYEKFYKQKKERFLNELENSLEYCYGFEDFFRMIKKLGKKTAIVTHSDSDIIKSIQTKLALINEFDIIITKDDYHFKKPHPEPYLMALSHFKECTKIIGFEDSYKGYLSLKSSGITPILICNDNYPFLNKMNPNYRYNHFGEIDLEQIKISNYYNNFQVNIDRYINAINSFSTKTQFIDIISTLVLNNKNNNVYLTGIGKCGHIAKKSVSTWQSMGISCHYINIPDLFHGDFGILQSNDIVIYISNSGNTLELINCAKYIKEHFNVLQIALTINLNPKISDFINYNFNIAEVCNVREQDSHNLAPTTSSIILMMALDLIGTYLSEKKNHSIEQFKLCHPGGDLGKVTGNYIDYVCIVASGSGSRLSPLTNYIPKILVEFQNYPFLFKLLDYWSKYTKNILIIINSKYSQLVDFYTTFYKSNFNNDLRIKLIYFDLMTGTADTIHQSITNEYYFKNILFSWCDIVPADKIDTSLMKTNMIFTYGNQCRYKFQNNSIVNVGQGGDIIGLYFIKNFNGLKKYCLGDDLVDVLSKNSYNELNQYGLNSLIDIGEMDKYDTYLSNEGFVCRNFNRIIVKDNIITKESINKQGDEIIKREINWYNYVNKYNFSNHFIEGNGNKIQMLRIKGEPIYKIFDNLKLEEKLEILSKIQNKLSILHSLETLNIENDKIMLDIRVEFYEKVINRLTACEPILMNVKNIIKTVDGFPIENFNKILNDCYEKIRNNFSKRDYYNIIVGDCQFSNILIDFDKEIYLIDPRGYFGNSQIFGLKEYDIAKLIYALSGYDKFNNNPKYTFVIENTDIQLGIEDNLVFLEYLNLEDPHLYYAMLVIIWFSLAQYNINNYYKCIASYYRAIYLYSKYVR